MLGHSTSSPGFEDLHYPLSVLENPGQASIRLTLFEHIFNGMTLRQAALVLVLVLGTYSPALASPAQNLFDQATFLIGFYYNGPARVPHFRELRRQYQPQLDQLCAAHGERCGFDQARKVIVRILQDIADPFMVLMTSQQLVDDRRLGAGRGPAAPRIGVWVRETPRGLVVSEAFPGEPAFEAGLRRGDLITQVEGQPATLAGLASAETSRNPFGLSYSRQGSAHSVILAPRVAEVAMRPRLEVTGNIAYLRVYHLFSSEQFSPAEYIHTAARRAEEAGARGMVIDLRDALSGYDSEALLAATAFTGQGGFIYDRRFVGLDETHTVEGGRLFVQPEGEQKEELIVLQQPHLTRLPVVVLVNRNTINSTEMLAYFLQAAGRARVVGEPTAGALGMSGSAQGPLINGEFITVSSLRMRHLDGTAFPLKVTPDVLVEDDPLALVAGRDLALERALELLR
jgi:carboxyl-terminal processing protease